MESLRPGEKAVAPGGVLGSVAQVVQNGGQKILGRGVVGFGEHRMAGELGGESKITFVKERFRLGHRLVDPTECLHVPRTGGLLRVLPQVGRDAVVPAQVRW